MGSLHKPAATMLPAPPALTVHGVDARTCISQRVRTAMAAPRNGHLPPVGASRLPLSFWCMGSLHKPAATMLPTPRASRSMESVHEPASASTPAPSWPAPRTGHLPPVGASRRPLSFWRMGSLHLCRAAARAAPASSGCMASLRPFAPRRGTTGPRQAGPLVHGVLHLCRAAARTAPASSGCMASLRPFATARRHSRTEARRPTGAWGPATSAAPPPASPPHPRGAWPRCARLPPRTNTPGPRPADPLVHEVLPPLPRRRPPAPASSGCMASLRPFATARRHPQTEARRPTGAWGPATSAAPPPAPPPHPRGAWPRCAASPPRPDTPGRRPAGPLVHVVFTSDRTATRPARRAMPGVMRARPQPGPNPPSPIAGSANIIVTTRPPAIAQLHGNKVIPRPRGNRQRSAAGEVSPPACPPPPARRRGNTPRPSR